MFHITGIVRHLLIINILFFLASQVMGTDILALYYPGSAHFMPYQLVTYMFMHGGLPHLFFNMFALVSFGSALEMLWGGRRFLFFYFFCAIGAALFYLTYNWYEFSQMQHAIDLFKAHPTIDQYIAFSNKYFQLDTVNPEFGQSIKWIELNWNDHNTEIINLAAKRMQDWLDFQKDIPMVGASGAIYGLLIAFGLNFPDAELMMIFLPVPIKARYFIPGLIALEFYLGIQHQAGDNIAHIAHLGGAFCGYLLLRIWWRFGTKL